MTDIVPAWVVTASGAPPDHGGRNYVPQMIPSGLRPSLEMLHLFGSDFDTVYPERLGIAEKSTGDHSHNGRHLTKIGTTPVGAKSFTSSVTQYFLSPLTGAQLMALGPDGSFSAYVVGKFGNQFALGVGTWNSAVVDGWGLGHAIGFTNRYQVSTMFLDAGSADMTTGPVILDDADNGIVYDFLAAVYDIPNLSVKLYWQKAGGSLLTASTALSSAVFAPQQRICFGRSYPSASYSNGCELVGGGCFSSAVSAGGIADLQGITKTFMTANGVTI